PVRTLDLAEDRKYSSILLRFANRFELPYKLPRPAVLYNKSWKAMRARQLLQLRKRQTPPCLFAERSDAPKRTGRLCGRIQVKLFASLCYHGPPQRLCLFG